MSSFEERTKVVGTLQHLSWEEAAFKLLDKVDAIEERKLKWTAQQFALVFINLRLVDMQFPLTEGVVTSIAEDTGSKLLAENLHYKTLQKIIENVIDGKDSV